MMHSIGLVVIYLFFQMNVMWVLYRILKNPSVVDVSWSVGLMVSGLMYLGFAGLTIRTIIIAALLIAWALRLALYLWYTRIRQGHIDKRYLGLSADWKISHALGFYLNFQLQGLLIVMISSVFWVISQSQISHITIMDGVAAFIIVLGIIGESVADLQLQKFKSQHQGQVCRMGLWRFSRHPNYFFDWLSFLGFALLGIQSPMGLLSILSPVMLYVIFTRITGPMTEKGSIQSKGDKYIQYQRQTSMFFPWFHHR